MVVRRGTSVVAVVVPGWLSVGAAAGHQSPGTAAPSISCRLVGMHGPQSW